MTSSLAPGARSLRRKNIPYAESADGIVIAESTGFLGTICRLKAPYQFVTVFVFVGVYVEKKYTTVPADSISSAFDDCAAVDRVVNAHAAIFPFVLVGVSDVPTQSS
jgi:hypothetical protein